jgi:hypothetical protein
MRYCIAALSALFTLTLPAPPTAQAQFFRDDFEDGSHTDGNPVTWVPEVPPFPVGDARVEAGSLVLTPTQSEFYPDFWETDWEVEQEFPADVRVRTQVRALSPGPSYQGIFARDTHNVDARQGRSLAALIAPSGFVGLYRVSNSIGTVVAQATVGSLGTFSRDIHLELELIGPRASVYAWEDGTPRPATPLLQFNNLGQPYVTPGRVGLVAGQEDAMPFISSAFRYFEVSPIPEPSTALLGTVALLPILHWKRRAH